MNPLTNSTQHGKHLLTRILDFFGEVLWIANVAKRTHSLTFARIMILAKRTPRFVPGKFRFPFGRIQYVDAMSLTWQYPEIFSDRIYEVLGVGDAPYIIDCGGNIGLSVIWFKQRYPSARITVFEADPAIAKILEENVRWLGLLSVEVVSAAVGNISGSVEFLPDGADAGRVTTGSGLTVPSLRLSDYIREPVDILKLDIEGSEFDVIRDLCNSDLIRFVKNIMCEIHGRSEVQDQIGEFWINLTKAGYRIAVRWAEPAEIPGEPELTPFPSVTTAKFLIQVYAWRQQ